MSDTRHRTRSMDRLAVGGVLLLLAAAQTAAYGPAGHLIAGRAAEPLLCERAASEVRRLGDGDDLGELGLWADRIRSDPQYADAAPWHYMNLADGRLVADFVHPPEGDVLWAIERFRRRLGDATLDDQVRAEALRFLVHFVVDLHQPLHVGLVEDRGGNDVRLRFRGDDTNLHRFWDTNAIEALDLSVTAYARQLAPLMDAAAAPSLDPQVWAEESLALRPEVYDYGRAGAEPGLDYVAHAAEVTRERLALAALRLAGTLNAQLCQAG